MSEIYTVKEAAEYLKVSDWTIRNLVNSSELEHVKFGRIYRFTEENLKNFLKAKEIKVPEADQAEKGKE